MLYFFLTARKMLCLTNDPGLAASKLKLKWIDISFLISSLFVASAMALSFLCFETGRLHILLLHCCTCLHDDTA